MHEHALREIAVNQLNPSKCVSGGLAISPEFVLVVSRLTLLYCCPGHDQILAAFDFQEMRLLNKVKLPNVISSVKWPLFNQSERVQYFSLQHLHVLRF